ncbi:hypothetical protein BGX23_003609 [Mortierella sp. AD031]|nr:hypothetical protein BGX23_003609 [Mortierella sp. AD031]
MIEEILKRRMHWKKKDMDERALKQAIQSIYKPDQNGSNEPLSSAMKHGVQEGIFVFTNANKTKIALKDANTPDTHDTPATQVKQEKQSGRASRIVVTEGIKATKERGRSSEKKVKREDTGSGDKFLPKANTRNTTMLKDGIDRSGTRTTCIRFTVGKSKGSQTRTQQGDGDGHGDNAKEEEGDRSLPQYRPGPFYYKSSNVVIPQHALPLKKRR